MYGWRARVGLVAPSRGDTMMYEYNKLAPDGVLVVPYITNLKDLDTSELNRVQDAYETAVRALDREKVDVIYVGGTPPQLVNGLENFARLSAHLRSLTDIPLVMCVEGEVAALVGNGVTKAAVLTPHEKELDERFRGLLEFFGIDVVTISGLGYRPAYEISFITDTEVFRRLLDMGKETRGRADGLHMTCGRWPSIYKLSALEEILGIPVISSSQTWIWSTMATLGISPRDGDWGSLFEVPASALADVRERFAKLVP